MTSPTTSSAIPSESFPQNERVKQPFSLENHETEKLSSFQGHNEEPSELSVPLLGWTHDQTGAQLLRGFMREYVKSQQEQAEYDAWFRRQVQIGLVTLQMRQPDSGGQTHEAKVLVKVRGWIGPPLLRLVLCLKRFVDWNEQRAPEAFRLKVVSVRDRHSFGFRLPPDLATIVRCGNTASYRQIEDNNAGKANLHR